MASPGARHGMRLALLGGMNIKTLNSWIKSHGFETAISNDTVTVWIPFCKDGKHAGDEAFTVRTMSEARDVLGY